MEKREPVIFYRWEWGVCLVCWNTWSDARARSSDFPKERPPNSLTTKTKTESPLSLYELLSLSLFFKCWANGFSLFGPLNALKLRGGLPRFIQLFKVTISPQIVFSNVYNSTSTTKSNFFFFFLMSILILKYISKLVSECLNWLKFIIFYLYICLCLFLLFF